MPNTPLSYDTPATSILGLIGGTPLVRIQRMCPNPKVTIMAKLEGFNPTGSIKDRIALKMIEQAEQEGTLTHDKIIVEPTSGNTGIALAMIGAVKGYQVEIVMSEAVSVERRLRSQGHVDRPQARHRWCHHEGARAGARFSRQILHA
jgi:cysteine synthase B